MPKTEEQKRVIKQKRAINRQLFDKFQWTLGIIPPNVPEFKDTCLALVQFFKNRRGYYDEARTKITAILATAIETFKAVFPEDKIAAAELHESLTNLTQVLKEFIDYFDPPQKIALRRLIQELRRHEGILDMHPPTPRLSESVVVGSTSPFHRPSTPNEHTFATASASAPVEMKAQGPPFLLPSWEELAAIDEEESNQGSPSSSNIPLSKLRPIFTPSLHQLTLAKYPNTDMETLSQTTLPEASLRNLESLLPAVLAERNESGGLLEKQDAEVQRPSSVTMGSPLLQIIDQGDSPAVLKPATPLIEEPPPTSPLLVEENQSINGSMGSFDELFDEEPEIITELPEQMETGEQLEEHEQMEIDQEPLQTVVSPAESPCHAALSPKNAVDTAVAPSPIPNIMNGSPADEDVEPVETGPAAEEVLVRGGTPLDEGSDSTLTHEDIANGVSDEDSRRGNSDSHLPATTPSPSEDHPDRLEGDAPIETEILRDCHLNRRYGVYDLSFLADIEVAGVEGPDFSYDNRPKSQVEYHLTCITPGGDPEAGCTWPRKCKGGRTYAHFLGEKTLILPLPLHEVGSREPVSCDGAIVAGQNTLRIVQQSEDFSGCVIRLEKWTVPTSRRNSIKKQKMPTDVWDPTRLVNMLVDSDGMALE